VRVAVASALADSSSTISTLGASSGPKCLVTPASMMPATSRYVVPARQGKATANTHTLCNMGPFYTQWNQPDRQVRATSIRKRL
jgi:hypothetical protein